MANFTYPSRDIDKPETLLALLGSFWQNIYTADNQVRTYADARGQAELQKVINLQEAEDLLSRISLPIYHTDRWHLIRLKLSEKNQTEPTTLRYGDNHVTSPAVYGRQSDGFRYRYGVPFNQITSSFPIPKGLKEAPLAFSGIKDPGTSLCGGLDYYLDLQRGLIVFRDDPFENPDFYRREIYSGETLVDTELNIWLYQAQLDWEYIWNYFGYILGISLPSGEPYKRLVNAIFDGVVEGTAVKHLNEAFAAIADTPIVKEESEVVEDIVRDARHLLIITDKNVYRFNKSASEVVAVGQTVQQYDQLVDTVTFHEFNRGQLDDLLISLEIPRDSLAGNYLGGISFSNKEVPLRVGSDGIFTTVEFEVGGFPGDVEEFWSQFHQRGVENPPTLAQLLDQRTNKSGEPTAAALPATINPLKFLAENVLRHHTYVVSLKINQFGPLAAGVEQVRHLRELIPPHTNMLILMQLAADNDIVTMEGPGSELEPGYTEDPALGFGNEVTGDTVDPGSFVSESPYLRHTQIRCL